MLKILTCECSSVESLARGLLQEAEIANWMEVPIHKGKEHCLNILSHYPESHQATLEYRALADFIPEASSYVIVVGADETRFYWENFADNAPIERARARAIAKEFA